jgi:hypothetical protein
MFTCEKTRPGYFDLNLVTEMRLRLRHVEIYAAFIKALCCSTWGSLLLLRYLCCVAFRKYYAGAVGHG